MTSKKKVTYLGLPQAQVDQIINQYNKEEIKTTILVGNTVFDLTPSGKGTAPNRLLASKEQLDGSATDNDTVTVKTVPAGKRYFITHLSFNLRTGVGSSAGEEATLELNTLIGSNLKIAQLITNGTANYIENTVISPSMPLVLEEGEKLVIIAGSKIYATVCGFAYSVDKF